MGAKAILWTLGSVLWLALSAAAARGEALPDYTIFYTRCPIVVDGRLDEAAWQGAPSTGPFSFPWWEAGAKETTEAHLLWDRDFLYVAFVAQDRHIWATLTQRDDPVSRDDAVEVFVAPDTQAVTNYFNLEFNALATILDCAHCKGATSYAWTARGLRVAVKVRGTLNREEDVDSLWTTEIAIPFRSLSMCGARVPPRDGDVWRLNLYRTGGRTDPQYSVWSDTETKEPQFHAPRRFGIVRFSAAPVPAASSAGAAPPEMPR